MESELHLYSKLVIHVQVPVQQFINCTDEELKKNNIEVIEKTVGPPGLYSKGDVYVYPAELDGLGLTLYEALACGIPVIGTDIPPINEVVDENVGRLIKVKEQKNRPDNYYWPTCVIDENSLYEQMKYFIDHKDELPQYKQRAREKALQEYDWKSKKDELNQIFASVVRMDHMPAEQLKKETIQKYHKRIKRYLAMFKMDIRNLLTLRF